MAALARWLPRVPALRLPVRVPWQAAPDLDTDHGQRPYAAWEAELSAYARLRAGVPVEVTFGLSTLGQWADAIQIARPPANVSAGEAFRTAELELEHLMAHFRHGSREIALYWHTWAHPLEPVRLPWPPWDQVDLPGRIVRRALLEGVAGFQVPAAAEAWPERQRSAALWLAAAWADGIHRQREVETRPGMADRMPLPPRLSGGPWLEIIWVLATGSEQSTTPVSAEALTVLRAASVDDPESHTRAVIDVVTLLARRGALPPGHRQHPAWLHPAWGRWRRAVALQRALAEFVRSPSSAELATLTSKARSGRALSPMGGGHGSAAAVLDKAGLAKRQRGDPLADAKARVLSEGEPDEQAWGVPSASELPASPDGEAGSVRRGAREGSGLNDAFGGTLGAGPGTLGALHIVEATPSDRAAYWQLRAALAPQIERLVERLKAASDQADSAAPRRFQRAGRLDRNRFPAAMTGREKIFVRRVHQPEPAHALCLLIDCSASMTTRAEQLREAAILLESAAASVGARVCVFLFGPAWERMEPPAEGAPLVALGRQLHPHGGTPFGPAVAAAAEWLARQPYQHKRLWVFSDGQWSARDRAVDVWRPEQLHDVVVWVMGSDLPEPPHPAMRLAAAPALDDLVQLAPQYFWAKDQQPGRLS